jgi:four helix bundle protein
METKEFRTFEDLEVYRLAREFRKAMYHVSRRLPEFEKFELASQIRRAVVSLTNNIAEGHGRWHFLDHIRFALQSRGSLAELQDDLNTCLDEQYLPVSEVKELKARGWHVLKVMNGYLRWLRNCKTGSSLELHESPALYGADCQGAGNDDELESWLAALFPEGIQMNYAIPI